MRYLVIGDNEAPERTAALAIRWGVGLECTTFYDTNYLEEHPNGIAEYLQVVDGVCYKTMHGPFTGLNTGVRDRMIRDVTLLRYTQACETARKLGIRDIVIHNNWYDYCAPRNVWRVNTRQLFAELMKRIDGCDVCFHLENTLERDCELMKEVVLETGSPKLDICLDIGHTQGMVHGGMTALEWIEQCGSLIGHVHLHNNHGQRDEHNNLPDGTLPIPEILAALEEKAPNAGWCLECGGHPGEDATSSLEYLDRLGYLEKAKARMRV